MGIVNVWSLVKRFLDEYGISMINGRLDGKKLREVRLHMRMRNVYLPEDDL